MCQILLESNSGVFQVKNKKRWSQVMYMSYLLDYYMLQHNVAEDDAFILTTDADVKFG